MFHWTHLVLIKIRTKRNRFKKKEDKKMIAKEDARLLKRPPPTNGKLLFIFHSGLL